MARNVNANLEQVGFRNIGVKERPNLTVLRRTKIPAILIEAGFLNSDQTTKDLTRNFKKSHKRSQMELWKRSEMKMKF